MENVRNKWAFITGASRGIGYHIAKYMGKEGCNLVIHSRKEEHLLSVKEELESNGIKVYIIACDLANTNEVKNMLQQLDELNVDIDYVFNNAGMQVTYRNDYFSTPSADFDISFRINTTAPMMICYHFLPKMIKKNYGRIVNTTSGIKDQPQQAAYSASKAALDKITKDLALTIDGTNVMINLFDPGWCRTDLGGEYAPNDVSTTLPGSVLGVFSSDLVSGRIIDGQKYANLPIDKALEQLENESKK